MLHLSGYGVFLFFGEVFCHTPEQGHCCDEMAGFVSGYVLEGLTVDVKLACLTHYIENCLGPYLGEEEACE